MHAADRAFIDSNILLYALDVDREKRDIAWEILFSKPCISIQVLNECSNVLNRKKQWPIENVAETLDKILRFVDVEPSDVATVRSAWALQAKYRFSYFDSLILSTALAARCATLFSEDLPHKQVIEGRLTIFEINLKMHHLTFMKARQSPRQMKVRGVRERVRPLARQDAVNTSL